MTAAESVASRAAMPMRTYAPLRRNWLVFGTGFGIAIGAQRLDLAIVRSRAKGPKLVASGAIEDFRSRPAAEWGAEVVRFLHSAGERNLVATALLPREEVIVRTLRLPGVPDKDIAAAVELQVDTLHPYADEEVSWAWARAGRDTVLVGLVRKALLNAYETLFSEAGIGLAAVTFSSAAIHAALRIWSAAPASLLCFNDDEGGRTEVYGESEAKPLYSAEFSFPPERALSVARAELRLPPNFLARTLREELPAAPKKSSPLAYAAALTASATLAAKTVNFLPRDRRASSARRHYLLPAILAVFAIAGALAAFLIVPALEQRRYLDSLNNEIHRFEPAAARAQILEQRIASGRARLSALDQFRQRTPADLDVLNELSRILPPKTWANSIEIYPDNVVIAGETDQAGPLLKLLDSSPLFQNSEFALSVSRTASGQTEQFRIKTMRRNRVGRTTP
ncbi:MAG TPA: PilN domain-containing protein [Bryobacteraceae bacterium]|nr:PilN domain-containing protein [Bryobacteraceae bacterium]